MSPNPNWPLVDVAVSFNSGPQSAMPAANWCSMVDRTMGLQNIPRGRQYELDQVQTGTWTGSLQNKDGALDPSNTGSPFYPQVVPYRAFRHRAQYPATVNILTADQATAGFTSSLSAVPFTWVNQIGVIPISLVAFSGSTNQYQLTYAAASALGSGVELVGFSVKPGVPHTASGFVYAGANNGLKIQPSILWYKADGTLISTSTGTAVTITTTIQRLTITATAPSNAAGGAIRFLNSLNPSANTACAILQMQMEYSSSASTYAIPGTWYSLFTGYVERWPQSWDMNGQFSRSDPTVVDAFGYLSQRKLLSAAYQEILALGPTFLYPLDEPQGSTSFVDMTRNRKPAALYTPPGLGAAAAGGIITSGQALAEPVSTGWPGPVVAVSPSTQPSGNIVLTMSLALGGLSSLNTPGPATSSWTRLFAVQPVLSATNASGNMFLWEASSQDFHNRIVIQLNTNASGAVVSVTWSYTQTYPASNSLTQTVALDNGFHVIGISGDGTNLYGWVDGTRYTISTSGVYPGSMAGGWDVIGIGPQESTGNSNILSANVALVAEIPSVVSAASMQKIFNTVRGGATGVSSGTRYLDILRWAGWIGLQNADAFTSGQTNDYGPPTELNAAASDLGMDTVSALQTVVDTESGSHYVAKDGTITFRSRRSRYNASTPVVTFGEQAGEVPYTSVKTGYDPTRVTNDATVSQTQTSLASRAVDATSISTYGDIPIQRTVNTLNSYEQSDAASYLVRRYSQPVQRVEQLQVNLGANPSLWASMLALELGTRVRVMRRAPLGAATIQVDGFVEQINWAIDDNGSVFIDLQVSVNNLQQFWQLDSSTFSVLDTSTIAGY